MKTYGQKFSEVRVGFFVVFHSFECNWLVATVCAVQFEKWGLHIKFNKWTKEKSTGEKGGETDRR